MSAIQERAASAARSLGHRWLGAEHVLLAVLSGQSASAEALRSRGITPEMFAREINRLSERYIGDRGVAGEPCPLTVRLSARVIFARAEGLAAGFGSRAISDDHVLLALLWERSPTVAEQLLGRLGLTRPVLLDQLKRLAVQLPAVSPPKRVAWDAWTPVPPEAALSIGRELRRAGTLYRLAHRDDKAFISFTSNDPDGD